MTTDAVVFWDFDGTLGYRMGGMWGAALLAALKLVCPGCELTAELLSAQLRTGFPWHESTSPHLHLCDPAAWWAHVQQILASALIAVGVGESEAIVCAGVARQEYIRPSAWALYDDSIPALEALVDIGVRNIILSNHVPELESLTHFLGLAPYLAGVITSAITGYEKPHPKAFEIGLQFAGSPARAYMVGDNPVADVEGAQAAGLSGVLVCRNGKPPTAQRTIAHLSEMVNLCATGR